MSVELQGSGKWNISVGQQLQVTREFIVPWSTHVAFVESNLGTPDPIFSICTCRSASVEPLGVISGSPATYSDAKVTLTYVAETQDWPSEGEEPSVAGSIKVQVRGGGEFLQLPPRNLKFESNPLKNPNDPIPTIDHNLPLLIPTEEWVVTLSNLSSVNRNFLTQKLGRVNHAPFIGYPAECVLFESWDLDAEWSFESGQAKHTWTVTYHLKVRTIFVGPNVFGWNHDYVGQGPTGWDRILLEDGNPRYLTSDFSNLFNPPP
jgi:hypothetical protein